MTPALVAGTALVLSLTACGGDDDEPTISAPTTTSAAPETTSASPTPSETVSPSPTASATAAAPTGDFTKPGTALKLGETATVPLVSGSKSGTIGVKVVSIKAGAAADLADLKLGDRAKGSTPYYVSYTVTNVGGTDLASTSISANVNGLLGDGSQAQSLLVIGTFDKCKSDSAGSDFTTAGATYSACNVFLAPAGTKVASADFDKSDVDAPAEVNYFDESITWS